MAYIPENAKWYLAAMSEEITVEGDSRSVAHKNYILIRADSPENAYEKAQELGKKSEVSYENPNGRLVHIRFKGLNQLNIIYDELEDGAEIHYEEFLGLSEEQVQALLCAKEESAVFRSISPSMGPDYSSRQVLEDVKHLLERTSDGGTRHKT
jgi:hypothetical protein